MGSDQLGSVVVSSASPLLPRLLDLRSHASTTEIQELADILVEMLEREQLAEQGRAELVARFSEPVLFDPDKPFKCCATAPEPETK